MRHEIILFHPSHTNTLLKKGNPSMKKAFVVFAVALILACGNLFGSSLDLENDLKNSPFYEEAMAQDRASLQVKLDRAVDNLIKTTIGELKKRGHHTLAGTIEMDYIQRYKGFVMTFQPGRDVGDHEAISWLLKIHDDIEFVIGPKLCHATRIHDLWVIAYTIRVVFSCQDNVDPLEYAKHYIPLSGIAARWVSYGTCCGLSLGTGVIYFCGLIADGVEELTIRFISPLLLPTAYKMACEK